MAKAIKGLVLLLIFGGIILAVVAYLRDQSSGTPALGPEGATLQSADKPRLEERYGFTSGGLDDGG